jgi:predicted AlkP superfamily pyrophosphatase or phosphodiesterase
MKNPLFITLTGLAIALAVTACGASKNNTAPTTATSNTPPVAISRVLLISIDGMHQQDLDVCINKATCPNLATLSKAGVIYQNANTPGLSDSFPGLAALITGGSPKTTGLFYDVSYDRTLYSPNDSTCTGKQGWSVVFDEATGLDSFNGGIRTHLDGGGSFNPQAIPHAIISGQCVPVYPHNYIQTNTLFEVVKQNIVGAHTAWADKHAWAYDWVNGPSGEGVDDLARTEINSLDVVTNSEYNDVYSHTEVFDNLHTKILINQIDGKDSANKEYASVPTVFGANYQTLSVAQKALNSKGGGYADANFTPNTQVAAAIIFVDAEIGKVVAELKAKNLYSSTAIIVTAKHGQSPSDHSLLIKHGDTLTDLLQNNNYLDSAGNWGQNATTSGNLNDGSGLVGTGMVQTDDVGLIWLKDQSQVATVLATLNANLSCTSPGICADGPKAYILSGAQMIDKFGDPALGRTPDIIVQPNPGVMFTASKKKDAEHGGNAPDDSHVALLVSLPSISSAQTVTTAVVTTQVAPTILKLLGLDPTLLNSVKTEGIVVLPNLNL